MAKMTVTVAQQDAGIRLDRWFKQHAPHIPFGMLQKWMRKGQVRLDGQKVPANARVEAGQVVSYPKVQIEAATTQPPKSAPALTEKERAMLRAMVLHEDDQMVVLNKPPGLAVQGGSKVTQSIDRMAVALVKEGEETPRLVHRLDRDTSGLLVLAKSAADARWLTQAFRERQVEKWYMAVVVGETKPREGIVDAPIEKGKSGAQEKMQLSDDGKRAETEYVTLDTVHGTASLLAMQPLTGRTHQLRVHAAALGTPILGDGKYGGQGAYLPNDKIAKKLHLHARRLTLPRSGKKPLRLTAPLPDHMQQTMELLGLEGDVAGS